MSAAAQGRGVEDLLGEYVESRAGRNAPAERVRAQVVTAFADTVLARLDTVLSENNVEIPDRTTDPDWHVGWAYFRAVAVHRAEQTITAAADAMRLNGDGRVMSGWAVLSHAAQLHARLFRFVAGATVTTHLEEAHDAVAAWNILAAAAADTPNSPPVGNARFRFLPQVTNRDPVGAATIGATGLPPGTQQMLDAGVALAGAHLGTSTLDPNDFEYLHPDPTAQGFERDVSVLQASVAIDLIASATNLALRIIHPATKTIAAADLDIDDVTAAAQLAHTAMTTVDTTIR